MLTRVSWAVGLLAMVGACANEVGSAPGDVHVGDVPSASDMKDDGLAGAAKDVTSQPADVPSPDAPLPDRVQP